MCGKIEIPRIIQAQLALVVREAGGWCGRLGAAMGCQHRADAHDTALKALRVCLRARGDVRVVFTRCAWRRA